MTRGLGRARAVASGNEYAVIWSLNGDRVTVEDNTINVARAFPYNWFNFYDFWNTKADPDPAAADVGADADAAVQRRTAGRTTRGTGSLGGSTG